MPRSGKQRYGGLARVYPVDLPVPGLTSAPGELPEPAAAVSDLFRCHHLELVRLAVIMVGDQATAEDVVQDVFERLHRRWHRLSDPASGLAYARSAVLNGCRTVHRRAAVRRRYLASLARPPGPAFDASENSADRGMLAEALLGLPARQREVLVLRYYCDLDVAEIAATVGIRPSSVRSAITRGLAALSRAVPKE